MSDLHKGALMPVYSPNIPVKQRGISMTSKKLALIALAGATSLLVSTNIAWGNTAASRSNVPINSQEVIAQCVALDAKPGPPSNFAQRETSDRFEAGTKPTLIQNATIWTGGNGGVEVLHGGSVFIDNGIIKHVGRASPDATLDALLSRHGHNVHRINARLAWLSPAINDLHSHIGVDSVPELSGSDDTNSIQGITQPWLRSLDGIDTHDFAYKLSISGGVATSLILPGSADAIGGQAFVIKLRDTKERSPLSKVLEPPYSLLNGIHVDPSLPPRWRHMKHAAGENPSRVYRGTRMDTIWKFRAAYNEARKIKIAQDNFCAKARVGDWSALSLSGASRAQIPESLQWEALVDVLRGRVKVNIHIYETTDFTGIVGLSNEFEFPIAAFHHAHEAYLVPDLIKQTYGGTPGIAIFATNARYKRESYRGTEFAAKILSEAGIRVAMKSDHPVLNSRFLLYEAAQAHYFGFEAAKALSAVTSVPAELAGFGHRLGYVKVGHDADLVLWDSHPLALGATPQQTWIDGIAQLTEPHVLTKPDAAQHAPKTPSWDTEAAAALKYDGLPPLAFGPDSSSRRIISADSVVKFINVKSLFQKTQEGRVESAFTINSPAQLGTVVVKGGKIICSGSCVAVAYKGAELVDLEGGSISPGLISFGSGLGLVEISAEKSTNDGYIFDPIRGKVPSILKDVEVKAVDGLSFGGRNELIAYRSGVTTAITAPLFAGVFGGLSTAFSLGAAHKLEKHAVVQDVTALHVALGHFGAGPSVSTQIAALRKALQGGLEGDRAKWFKAAANGEIPLVVNVVKADHIATLLLLKKEIDAETKKSLRLVLAQASEAHLLAQEIGEAGVGVILSPARQFPASWDQQRALPGPPLTKQSAIGVLLSHNVTLGLGIVEEWEARLTRFDLAWAALEANGTISKNEAISLGSSNLESILGLEPQDDLVAYRGGDFSQLESKPVAVLSGKRGLVDLL